MLEEKKKQKQKHYQKRKAKTLIKHFQFLCNF